MANADPAVIGAQIGNGNASQVSANSRAHQHLSVACSAEDHLFSFVQNSLHGVIILLVHLTLGQPSNEDGGTIPDDLKNLSRR